MLTNSDFVKIKTIVKDVVKDEVDPLKVDVRELQVDVKDLKVDVKQLKKETKQLGRRLKKVERYSKNAADFLDRQNIDLEKRTERIEHHLGLPSLQ